MTGPVSLTQEKFIRAYEQDVPLVLRNKSATLADVYFRSNVSGHLYRRLLSQESLLERSKAHVAKKRGTVYRPNEAREASFDSRGLPVSTVVDLPTAFWQGATARAAAQRTVSAVGLALTADALRVMGPEGMARWGNHPLAVVLRAALPLRVAAWPAVLWNQNLVVVALGAWAGPLQSTTIGSGLAEYVIGTGFHDRPDAPQVSPGYMVVAPPAYEEFKAMGFLGVPERALIHAAVRLMGADDQETAQLRTFGARACLMGATALRVTIQAFRLPLCAVWSCELLLGGLVGLAHVFANHAMQLMVLGMQRVGAMVGLVEAPSRPMWRSLENFPAQHAREPEQHLKQQNAQQEAESMVTSRAASPEDASHEGSSEKAGPDDKHQARRAESSEGGEAQGAAAVTEKLPLPSKLKSRHTMDTVPHRSAEKPGLRLLHVIEQL